MEKEEENFLKKYFKRIFKCKKCGVEYGSDKKKDNGYCPICGSVIWNDKKLKKKEVKQDARILS